VFTRDVKRPSPIRRKSACIIRVPQCSTKGRKVGTLVARAILHSFSLCISTFLHFYRASLRKLLYLTPRLIFSGWKCCKPRVLTFEEFLAIPPCTTGKHSTVDETPAPEPPKVSEPAPEPAPVETKLPERPAISPAVATPTTPAAPPPEPDSDDPDLEIPANATCRRRGCGATYTGSTARDEEKCIHHPGQPVFHEGSKGWSCCKRRVLEFDQFLKIPGCTEKTRHMFVGKAQPAGEEKVESVRYVDKQDCAH